MSKIVVDSEKRITQPYKGTSHTGVDIGWRKNEDENILYAHSQGIVKTIVDGLVTVIGSTGMKSYGNYIDVEHVRGNDVNIVRIAHIRKNTFKVKVGDIVDSSTQLALMGESGNVSGRHAHIEVFKNGVRVDPAEYLTKDFPTETNVEEKKHVLKLPATATSWRIYPLNKKPVVGNECGKLLPSKFGGLTYDILRYSQNDVAVINTRDFGEVQIYVAKSTSAIIE